MKQRSRRLTKKLHKKLLPDILYEVSTSPYWRKLLFESKPNEVLGISYSSNSTLSNSLRKSLATYHLEFSVSVVSENEAESWLSENGSVIFKFWANAIPSLKMYSGNNRNCIG